MLLERPWKNVSSARAAAWADAEMQRCVAQGKDPEGSQTPKECRKSSQLLLYPGVGGGGVAWGEEKGEVGPETSLVSWSSKKKAEVGGERAAASSSGLLEGKRD